MSPDYQAPVDTPDCECAAFQTEIEGTEWFVIESTCPGEDDAWIRMAAGQTLDVEAWA